MHTRLLNLGFSTDDKITYVCEDIVLEVRGNLLYVDSLKVELTIEELENFLFTY